MKKKEFDLTVFEPLVEVGQELKGGFSIAFNGGNAPIELPPVNAYQCVINNNYVAGCGVRQKG